MHNFKHQVSNARDPTGEMTKKSQIVDVATLQLNIHRGATLKYRRLR